jgi:hypothetical protein
MYAADSIRKYQALLESAMSDKDVERQEAQQKKAKEAKAAKKEEKKPANVKESAAEFFRRYSDIIVEAEQVDEEETEQVNEISDELASRTIQGRQANANAARAKSEIPNQTAASAANTAAASDAATAKRGQSYAAMGKRNDRKIGTADQVAGRTPK